MKYLALCCIVKNESPFLEEWVAFHTLMGVEAFIIYDNGSKEPVQYTLRRLLSKHYITVIQAPGRAQQIPCYDHCLRNFGPHFAWIGFLDMDEFALPLQHGDLRLLLAQYSDAAGLGMHWLLFGSNRHMARPQGLQIENYTMAMPLAAAYSRLVKLFVRPSRIRHFINPHLVSCLPGHSIVNENGRPIRAPFSDPAARDLCRINHYYYRSRQDYYEKIQRGYADMVRKRRMPKRMDIPVGDTEDLHAARFAPLVRRLLDDKSTCARLAARLDMPATAEGAATLIGEYFAGDKPHEALILLAKLVHYFPGHPVTRALMEQASPLVASLGLRPLWV